MKHKHEKGKINEKQKQVENKRREKNGEEDYAFNDKTVERKIHARGYETTYEINGGTEKCLQVKLYECNVVIAFFFVFGTIGVLFSS